MVVKKRNPQARQKAHLRVNGKGQLAKEERGKKKIGDVPEIGWGPVWLCPYCSVNKPPFFKARTASLLSPKEEV